MSTKSFPIAFNLQAFDNVSNTIDKVNRKFESSFSGFSNRMMILNKGTERWRGGLTKVGDSIQSAGKKLTVGVTLPLSLLAGKFVHSSIEAEETASKFEGVFDGVSKAARDSAISGLTKNFDLATQTAQEMVSTTGLLAQDLGLTGNQALKMGTQVTALSVQMAAFRNIEGGAEAASELLRGAMLGQTKGLAKLGIKITENQVKSEAQALAMSGVKFASVEQAKAMATLSLVQKRTGKDQKDFAESSGAMENQLRVSGELFKEISAQMGNILKPAFAAVLGVVNNLQKKFLALSPEQKKMVVIFGAIAAAVGPLLVSLGFFIGTIMPALITGLSAVAALFGAISLPILAAVAAVALLAVGGYMLVKHWDTVKAFFGALWDGPIGRFLNIASYFVPFIGIPRLIIENWAPIKAFFGRMFDWIGEKATWLWENSGLKLLMTGVKNLGQLAAFGRGGQFGLAEQATTPGTTMAGGFAIKQDASLQAQAQATGKAIAQEVRTTNDARVSVDFANAPRGTRVTSQSSGIPPQLNLGFAGGTL